MIIRIRRPRIILAVIGMFAVMLVGAQFFKQDKAWVESGTMYEAQSLMEDALVWTYLPKIRERSDDFYAIYYTINPSVVSYNTTVKEVYKKDGLIYITFTSLPYIGPHDTIGEDEITFSVRHTGEIAAQDFEHLKSYSLPDNLKNIEKGPLPAMEK